MNDNVLKGYSCPECKSEGPFNIYGRAWFLDVEDDGCSDFECFNWHDEAAFSCRACGHQGKAREFETERKDERNVQEGRGISGD
jgi:hypothetical protein